MKAVPNKKSHSFYTLAAKEITHSLRVIKKLFEIIITLRGWKK